MNIVTAIQARTSSTRLSNKVFMPLYGAPLLLRMAERVQRASLAGQIVIATTVMAEDDCIAQLCVDNNIQCFRGSLNDLLDRHYHLAVEFKADALVKIPSDCPLIDPSVIDLVIGYYLKNQGLFDYVSNLHPASWPDGNDVEIMSFGTLKTAFEKAHRHFEREHTTPYILEHPDEFRIGNLCWASGQDFSSSHRWTIDYKEDYEFIHEIYEKLSPENPSFGLDDILQLTNQHPEISAINKQYAGQYWYTGHLDELTTIDEFKYKITRNEA